MTRWLVLAVGVVGAAALGSAPPPPENKEVRKLVDRLRDEDLPVRRAAMKKLAALDDAPLLRREAARQADVDVKLRLWVGARAIHERSWGPVKALGPGAAAKARPFGDGYWL